MNTSNPLFLGSYFKESFIFGQKVDTRRIMEKIFSLEIMLLLNAIVVVVVIFQVLKFWKNSHSSQFQENLWNNPEFRARVEKEVDYIALEAPKKKTKKQRETIQKEDLEKTKKTVRFQSPNFLGAPHEVLGIARDASKEEIDAAYRHWIKRYHPDRVAHLGPGHIRQANKRTEALNKARAFFVKQNFHGE